MVQLFGRVPVACGIHSDRVSRYRWKAVEEEETSFVVVVVVVVNVNRAVINESGVLVSGARVVHGSSLGSGWPYKAARQRFDIIISGGQECWHTDGRLRLKTLAGPQSCPASPLYKSAYKWETPAPPSLLTPFSLLFMPMLIRKFIFILCYRWDKRSLMRSRDSLRYTVEKLFCSTLLSTTLANIALNIRVNKKNIINETSWLWKSTSTSNIYTCLNFYRNKTTNF